jgi:hypothetical protein
MTDAVVWLVLWFVFMVVGMLAGQIFGFLMSFGAIAKGDRKLLWFTIPAGLLGFAFGTFALIQTILQIVDVFQRAVS